MNYCQHQRNQADGRLAALALELWCVARFVNVHGQLVWKLGGGFRLWAGEPPGFRFEDRSQPNVRPSAGAGLSSLVLLICWRPTAAAVMIVSKFAFEMLGGSGWRASLCCCLAQCW